MKVEVTKGFEKDIADIKDKGLASRLYELIDELERAESLNKIANLKKMQVKGNYYRIRVGAFRLGLRIENEKIILLRFMNRKDIYKYFP